MVAVMLKYVEAAVSWASSTPKKSTSRRRPNQKVVALKDLSPVERAELADRLEAELARL